MTTPLRICLRAVCIYGLTVAGIAHAQGAEKLDTGRAAYKREKQTIEIALLDSGKAASAAYLKDLQTLVRQMEQAGDDFGVRPAKAEI